MGWLADRLHQSSTPIDEWRCPVGTSRGSDANSSSLRTSMIEGAPGKPTRRASCGTVISVGEGMAASTSKEDMDAIFQPRPYGVIAVDPLTSVHITAKPKSISCALAGGKPRRVEFPEVPQIAGRLGNEPVSEGN